MLMLSETGGLIQSARLTDLNTAHGHGDRYEATQVALLIQGVRGFISRHPA
jgi:hypothetical protein